MTETDKNTKLRRIATVAPVALGTVALATLTGTGVAGAADLSSMAGQGSSAVVEGVNSVIGFGANVLGTILQIPAALFG